MFLWYEEPLGDEGDWKSKALRGLDFSHVFRPFIGPGSYTMNCGIVMNLIETDSADEVLVYLESIVPVDALPGLRIFSPINELTYPVNVSLKVKTSFDKETEIWETIKWRLNGKEFKPDTGAPFFIDLNRTGKWSLQAELTVKNPQTGEDIPLKDRVDFMVNPIEISLTPTRKVFDLSKQKSQELSLNIALNGKKVEKPGESVEWSDDGLKAVVDPVEWFSATTPNGCATANHEEDNLTAGVDFTKTGAATALATVTVRLTDGEEYFRRRHKDFEDEFEEPVFSFPFVRADLWAASIGKIKDIEGHIPDYAITNTYRTWQIDSFNFEFNNNQHIWNTTNGIKPDLLLKPAISGIPSPTGTMQFNWNVGDNAPPLPNPTVRDERRFIFQPDADGNYTIKLITQIDFAIPDKLNLPEILFSLESLPFVKFIDAKITPVSFLIMTDESQLLQYSYEYLFGVEKDYKITLQDVVWSKPSGEIGNGQEFTFSYSEPVAFMLIGSGLFKAQEKFVEPPPKTDFTVKRESYAEVRLPPTINLTAYDLNSALIPVPDDIEETLGALIHFNIDNDNFNVLSGDLYDGIPLADFMESDYVADEDDLKLLKIELSYLPTSGNVSLWRDNDTLKVWSSPTKDATSTVLVINREKLWDLSDAAQKAEFTRVKNNLWVEGCASGTSGLTAIYQKTRRNISTDRIEYQTFFAPYGKQPNNTEHEVVRVGMQLTNLIDCEWAVTGEPSKKYNCIAWSVDEDTVFYDKFKSNPASNVVGIDQEFGDDDGTLVDEEIIAFYAIKGFEQIHTDSPWEADVIYFSGFHAAKRISPIDGVRTFFESKLGSELRIAHVWDQVVCTAYEKPYLFFKRKDK